MTQPKLKPCPWCGSTPKITEHHLNNGQHWYVCCSNDGYCEIQPGTVSHLDRKDAIAAWNTRKGESNE